MAREITLLGSDGNGVSVRLSNFAVGSHTLGAQHMAYLADHVAPCLRVQGSIRVIGLTSRSGSREFNQLLSRRRADSVIAALRKEAGYKFQVAQTLALGEMAAAIAGQPDRTEHPDWRSVLLSFWARPTPPPPPQEKRLAAGPLPYINEHSSKIVMLPTTTRRGLEERNNIAGDLGAAMAAVAMPDAYVRDGTVQKVLPTHRVTRIDIEKSGVANPFASTEWYKLNFTWGPPRGLVEIYESGSFEERVTGSVAMEIYYHPGHYIFRPRRSGASGWSR